MNYFLLGAGTFVGLVFAACGGDVTTANPAKSECTAGETFRAPDGCNTCSCSADGKNLGCTEKACVDATVPASECQPGATKAVDCNTCSCSGGRWLCTRSACVDAGVSSPGALTCNGAQCSLDTNMCCDAAEPDMPPSESCVPKGTLCGPVTRVCDDASDCAAGQVCCQETSAMYVLKYATRCSPKGSCTDSDFMPQFCKTDAECDNGKPCVAQSCFGRPIATCGGVPLKRCQ